MAMSARISHHFTSLSSACWLLSLGLSPMVIRWFLKLLEIIQIQEKKIEQVRKLSVKFSFIFFKGGKYFTDITQKIYPYVSVARTYDHYQLQERLRKQGNNIFNLYCVKHSPLGEKIRERKALGDFPGGTVVKNPPANAGDTGSSPGPGRSYMMWSN